MRIINKKTAIGYTLGILAGASHPAHAIEFGVCSVSHGNSEKTQCPLSSSPSIQQVEVIEQQARMENQNTEIEMISVTYLRQGHEVTGILTID